MASTSYSSSSSSSSSVPNIIHHKYDVFLSFRGEDTRHTFTYHLYDALLRAGLRTFRDNDSIDIGQQLKLEIEKAILESRASIIVLSENYANSRWCLEELVLILEQRRNFNHFVLPVFYHVDPSDVRNQRHSFAIESDPKWREVNDVNRWKSALSEVAGLSGMVVSGLETKFIRKIISTVYRKLDLKHLRTPTHLTGMDTRAEGINFWLRTDQSSAEALAICGMGGIGKTTLAQYIYDSNKQNFESSSFLMEIGKHYKQPKGLLELQKQLLADISGLKNETSFCFPEVTSKIEDALQMKRVLIVLDDIDDQDQLGALLGTKTLHTKIKIIITTRDLDIQAWFGSISYKCQVYNLKLLNDHESLELFSSHAFGSKVPMEDFKDLAVQFAQYCEGNPLALKVLGSSLYVSAEDPKERCINKWISTRNLLMSFKGDLDNKILGILKKSYDSLPHFSHRELFLHIAFFFVGEYEDDVVQILERDWHARDGITTLINRCLLTISPSKKLMMHQLLQEMGRTIVHEESKDPAKRSRVCQDDSYRVLEKGEGSQTIEGLKLDMDEEGLRSKVNMHGLDKLEFRLRAFKTDSFAKMDKLKLLKISAKLTGSFKNFPKLTWLRWHACHLKTIPSGLMSSNLVSIYMCCGDLKEFEVPTDLHSLKTLNFTCCWDLVSIRNLYRMPNLETLILWDCFRLTHICKTIAHLERLALLDLTGCDSLLKVSSKKKLINQLPKLKALELGHINWIKAFQDDIVELVGDEITKGRKQNIQMLYEYGIMSTYLRHKDGINQFIMSEYKSESPSLSFQVPFCPNKLKIQGLNVNVEYYSLRKNENQDERVLFAEVSFKNKGLTWMYNPVVFCKPARIERGAVWLSYWPVGHILEPGDEVEVSIIVGNGLRVSRCGASLVYVDCEFTEEKESENNAKGEEVIGGDLSEFELTKGVYYLCRRDLFKSMSCDWLKMLAGGNFHYTELQGWRNCRGSRHLDASFRELKTYRYPSSQEYMLKVIVRSKKRERKVLKAVSTISGVKSVTLDAQTGILTVSGKVNIRTVLLRIFKTRNFADFFSKKCCIDL